MNLVKAEKTAVNTYELELSLSPEQLKEAVSRVYRRDGKKYNVPGFRKGKAPRNRIEQIYGADVFVYDAVNDEFPAAWKEAVETAGIDPVASPQVDLVDASAEKGAVLKAMVTVRPEVKLGQYKGLTASRPAQKAGEEQVDAEIDRMRQRNARLLNREGAAQNGDIANINFEGLKDGAPFDGGKGENHNLELGTGSFIPGFEEQVEGHFAGDEFEVNVTFPAEYHAEDLAGKDAVFKVKLNSIQYKELDALDDEFAKDVSEYDSLEELKTSIRDGLQKELDSRADSKVESQLLDKLVEGIEGEIPEVMYENSINELVQNFAYRLESQGLNLDTYLKYSGAEPKTFHDGFRAQAEKQVKIRLGMEAIVRQEGIEVSKEDIDKEIERIAEQYKMEPDKVREIMPDSEITKDLAVGKALELVKAAAVITEKPPEKAQEAPAAEGAAPAKDGGEPISAAAAPGEDAPAGDEPSAVKAQKPAAKKKEKAE